MKTRTNALTLGACLVAAAALAGEPKDFTFEVAVPPPGADARLRWRSTTPSKGSRRRS